MIDEAHGPTAGPVPVAEEMGMDTAIIYCRLSDPYSSEEKTSLEQQEDACRAYCGGRGYIVLKVYHEQRTGYKNLAGRKEVWDAIDDIKYGRAQVIVSYSYERLARKGQYLDVLLYEIEDKFGGRFEAATEKVDGNDPMSKITRAVLGAAGEIERDRVVGRMARGKRDRSERGKLTVSANPHYGYRWVDDVKKGRTAYVEDDETAPVVRRIFQWAKEGKSTRWIARQLNAEGIPTPSMSAAANNHIGKRHVGAYWHSMTVRRILTDPTYAGQAYAYRWAKTSTHKKNRDTGIMEERVTTVLRDEDDETRIPLPETTWPALIDDATFAEVARRMGKEGINRMEARRNRKEIAGTLLRAGHIYCGLCKDRMYAERKRGYYIYRCQRRAGAVFHPDETCPAVGSVRAQDVDADAWNAVKYVVAHQEDLQAILEERLSAGKDTPEFRYVAGLGAVMEEKRAKKERITKLVSLSDDPDTQRDLIAQIDALNQEIRNAEKDLKAGMEVLKSAEFMNRWVQEIIARDMMLSPEGMDNLPYEEKRFLMGALGLRVDVWPKGYREDGKRWTIAVNPLASSATTLPKVVALVDMSVTLEELMHAA